MILYNKKKGYMANMDMVKDIFLGREPGTLAIGFKNGSATKLTVYSSEAEALEKQLPKKPVFKRNAYGGISVCPICGASDYGKYCRQCGQKID